MGTLIGIVVALASSFLAGALVTWAFDRLRPRRPTYVVTGNRVVSGNPDLDIGITFRGETVPVVSRTLVPVWNDGRETIKATDVTPSAPLTIVVTKADRILKATVAAATRPEIAFRADIEEPRSVVLSFHHLDYKDGATIEILHTASNPFGVDLTGDVIGTGGRLRKVAPPPLSDDPTSFRVGLLGATGAFLFAFGEVLHKDWAIAALAASLGLVIAITAFASRRSARRVPAALWRDLPGGLPIGGATTGNLRSARK